MENLAGNKSSQVDGKGLETQFLPGSSFYFRDHRIPSRRRDRHAARP